MTNPSSPPQAKHMLANDGMFCNNTLAPSNPVYWLKLVTVHLFPFFGAPACSCQADVDSAATDRP